MGLDGRKSIQSVKSAWSVLHAERKVRVLASCRGIIMEVQLTLYQFLQQLLQDDIEHF